jgi:predicted dehydrogenase
MRDFKRTMSQEPINTTTRRQFLKTTSGLVAATAVTGLSIPNVHADGDEEIRVALVGCGGRGSGAAVNALATSKQGPVKLVAMADVFEDRLKGSYDGLVKYVGKQMDVPQERRFVGFDAYKKAMDSLRPGDVVILTTPPAFRWVHYQYAISKKLNVFMEKPVTVDGPTSKRMLELNEQAKAAGIKVGVGLMSRHMLGMQELRKRVQDGELGEIVLMRGYRMHGPAATFESTPKPAEMSDLEYQIRRFHSYLWASGGCFNDFYIHIVDHLSWIKGALPVSAQGIGGRHFKQSPEGQPFVDQNFDSYGIEYTYADGTKMYFDGRCINNTRGHFASYLHGTKGSGIASRANDCGGPSATFKGHNMTPENLIWEAKGDTNPYQNEWDVLIDCIRNNKPHNEVQAGVEASMISNMGRMAAHTGQEITWDAMLNCEHEFAPLVADLTKGGPAPLMPDASGKYPQPQPGLKQLREF